MGVERGRYVAGSGGRCGPLFAAVLVSRVVGQQRRIPDAHVERDKVSDSADKPKKGNDVEAKECE